MLGLIIPTVTAVSYTHLSYAENGYFNYTINFNTGGKSKIRKIEYDATDSGSFNVINVGRYTVKMCIRDRCI